MPLQKDSPFAHLLLEVSSRLFMGEKDKHLVLVANQLSLLHAAYIELVQIGADQHNKLMRAESRTEIPFDEIVDMRLPGVRVTMCYTTIINSLVQFEAAVKKRISGYEVPRSWRVRWHRNKCNEHWADYIENVRRDGFTWKHGKAVIPTIEHVSVLDEKRESLRRLQFDLGNLNVSFCWPEDQVVSIMSHMPDYQDGIWDALESNPKLFEQRNNPIVTSVVRELFLVGFPLPIVDLERYGADLVESIRRTL